MAYLPIFTILNPIQLPQTTIIHWQLHHLSICFTQVAFLAEVLPQLTAKPLALRASISKLCPLLYFSSPAAHFGQLSRLQMTMALRYWAEK